MPMHRIKPMPEVREHYPRYWSVVIPYAETNRTEWHPTDRTGPWLTAVRGAFRSVAAAHEWAAEHIPGHDYDLSEHREYPDWRSLGNAGSTRLDVCAHAYGQNVCLVRATCREWTGNDLRRRAEWTVETPAGQMLATGHAGDEDAAQGAAFACLQRIAQVARDFTHEI